MTVAMYTCPICEGLGRRLQQIVPGVSMPQECVKCNGSGQVIDPPAPPPFRGKELTKEHLLAMFTLAKIPISKTWQIKNQYWNDPTYNPWWLVRTPKGLIEIGWRKNVMSINWEDTPVRAIITEDQVTKEESLVHAWSVQDAIRYLTELGKLLS